MTWKKGQSGNPAGRKPDPNAAEIRLIAKSHCPAAINRLVEWMASDNPRASVAAANILLDRGYGKPQQVVEVSHIHQMTDAEIERRLAELGAQLAAGNAGPAPRKGQTH